MYQIVNIPGLYSISSVIKILSSAYILTYDT